MEHCLPTGDSIDFLIHLIMTSFGTVQNSVIVHQPRDPKLCIAHQSLGEIEGKSEGYIYLICKSILQKKKKKKSILQQVLLVLCHRLHFQTKDYLLRTCLCLCRGQARAVEGIAILLSVLSQRWGDGA